MTDTTPAPRPAPARRQRPAWRTLAWIAGVIVIALVLAVVLSRCVKSGAASGAGGARGGGHGGRGGSAAAGPGGRPAITVGVAKAALSDIPITVSALGSVTPVATVEIQARVAGMLDRVGFREGQVVRKGQLLAQIDPRPFQVALDQAQGTLVHDEALLADARLDLKRYGALRAQDSIAGQTYDTQAALVRQDEGTVITDRAAVANARLNLSFTRVTSPVSGRIGLRQIDPGNLITANQTTPFTVVTQLDPITVVFSVPESAIGAIATQGAAGLKATAYDRAGGAVLATGTLATLDNLIDPTTGTVKAKASFANAGGSLFPNQFVNVVLLVDTLQRQVTVPTTAVRHGPQGDYVWLLQPDKTVKSGLVKVGPGTAETVSITSGLAVGQSVITDGGDRLRDGAKVVLPGQRPAGGAAAAAGHGHHRRGGGSGAAPAGG
ncbi:MAG TPA: efflux RND transporter periplasmic adaptor subunit [Caulobacteraceae bacterium]|nr:efflux RND transporter periplasmic adaptor subunit [Caulobacteraceae bacterium]